MGYQPDNPGGVIDDDQKLRKEVVATEHRDAEGAERRSQLDLPICNYRGDRLLGAVMLGKTIASMDRVLLALLEVDPQRPRKRNRKAGAIGSAVHEHPDRELRILRSTQLYFDRWMEGAAVP